VATGQGARFTLCQHTIVTSRADLNAGLRVVKFEDRRPLRRRLVMASLADVAGRQSRQMFALHDADVGEAGGTVATGAVAGEAGMINRCGLPTRNEMAGITRLGGRHVDRHALTLRKRAVVAGRAHRDAGFGVIKFGDRLPYIRERLMAFLAEIARDQSNGVFAPGRLAADFDAVVASNTSTRNSRVVDSRAQPLVSFVAKAAVLGRNNMSG